MSLFIEDLAQLLDKIENESTALHHTGWENSDMSMMDFSDGMAATVKKIRKFMEEQ